jgi:hypothetical protein
MERALRSLLPLEGVPVEECQRHFFGWDVPGWCNGSPAPGGGAGVRRLGLSESEKASWLGSPIVRLFIVSDEVVRGGRGIFIACSATMTLWDYSTMAGKRARQRISAAGTGAPAEWSYVPRTNQNKTVLDGPARGVLSRFPRGRSSQVKGLPRQLGSGSVLGSVCVSSCRFGSLARPLPLPCSLFALRRLRRGRGKLFCGFCRLVGGHVGGMRMGRWGTIACNGELASGLLGHRKVDY